MQFSRYHSNFIIALHVWRLTATINFIFLNIWRLIFLTDARYFVIRFFYLLTSQTSPAHVFASLLTYIFVPTMKYERDNASACQTDLSTVRLSRPNPTQPKRPLLMHLVWIKLGIEVRKKRNFKWDLLSYKNNMCVSWFFADFCSFF